MSRGKTAHFLRWFAAVSELRVLNQVDPSVWNKQLRSLGGTIFHAAEWAKYTLGDQRNAVPEFYKMHEDDGTVGGVALGFRLKSSRPLAGSFSGRRWLDAIPVTRDRSPEAMSRFIQLIERRARLGGDVTLRVGSFTSPGSEDVLRSLGFSITRRLEFQLPLDESEKSLWSGMNLNRQRAVKRAMKSGVEVKELPPDEGAQHLRRLQQDSFVRIAARGGPSLIKSEMDGKDPIATLIEDGCARVVGGFVDGVCVSAMFLTIFNGLAYYTMAGHDAKGLETRAPTLVVWDAMLRLKSEGIHALNLGGCGIEALDESSPEHGVYTYKEAFGGVRLECASGEKILRPAVRRMSDLLRSMVS